MSILDAGRCCIQPWTEAILCLYASNWFCPLPPFVHTDYFLRLFTRAFSGKHLVMPPKNRKRGAAKAKAGASKKAAPKKAAPKRAVTAAQKRKVLDALKDKMAALKDEIETAQQAFDEAYIEEQGGEHGGVLCSTASCGEFGRYNEDGELPEEEDEENSWGDCSACYQKFCSSCLQCGPHDPYSRGGGLGGVRLCEPCLEERQAEYGQSLFD